MLENLLNVTPNLNFDINVLYNLLISILCGLAIRFSLPFCNQNWVQLCSTHYLMQCCRQLHL